MHTFTTDKEAKDFVRKQVDVPVTEFVRDLGDGMTLHAYPQELSEDTFTNVYDLSFRADTVHPSIELPDTLTGIFDLVAANPDIRAATGGGFFFLADRCSAMPRQLSLNLALQDGKLRSLPVVDREAVIIKGEQLSAEYLQAVGTLALNGAEVRWAGSLTSYEAEAKVFANGNCIVTHVDNDETGSMRVLKESSRYTPTISDEESVDIGFCRREDGVFVGVASSKTGGLDIFNHDVVVRAHERHAYAGLPTMRVLTLGTKALDGSMRDAVSVGPMLDTENFTAHPINTDASLGGKPPFLDVPLARTLLYETGDDRVHIRLFDGRPGSAVFPGVAPNQTVQLLNDTSEVKWGCFLDPGQTAKLAVRDDRDIESYGNTHYLKWPKQPGEQFIWVPKTGRPVANMITVR